MVPLFIIAAVIVLGALAWHRWVNVLARIDVRSSRCTVVSGDLPVRLMQDVSAAARLSGFHHGTITIYRGGKVRTSPRDEGLEQRIRNAVGAHAFARLHTRGDGWVDRAKGVGGWLALNGLINGILRRLR